MGDIERKPYEGSEFKDSIITVNNFAFANVIYSEKSTAQANAATLIANGDIDAKLDNDKTFQLQKNED